jgi:acetoacetyl-CoA synthetase
MTTGTPRLLWQPSADMKRTSNMTAYMNWLKDRGIGTFGNYHQLWQWSVDQTDQFWKSLWDYFAVLHSGEPVRITSGDPMPRVRWFEGTRLSYAEHFFRKQSDKRPAILYKAEGQPLKEMSWKDLRTAVASMRAYLASHGVGKGDRVCAFLPCAPEATIAFLAANSLGAVWSGCSPDFGAQSVVDRFAQINPKVLIACTSYSYGGKTFDKAETVRTVIESLPGLKAIVLTGEGVVSSSVRVDRWADVLVTKGALDFERVEFSHPLWILFSSGTTGLPKPITHGTGGILIEQLKYMILHHDIREGDRCFWFTTTGWMMWNKIQSCLLCGGVLVLYDGSPAWPDLGTLWKLIGEAKIHHFGISAGFVIACMKEGIVPSAIADLGTLKSIGSTGSPLPPESFAWIYEKVKRDVWLASLSGGTDVCSAFVGGNPLWPVYEGEIQCRALGCNVEAFSEEGKPLLNEVGEMVLTKPLPSMPVFFWSDPDFVRYTESYFEMFPGIWRHGDWISITPRNGVIIYGRSDATLNRGGVRIGTAEVYRAVDKVSEVQDSLIICIEKEGGEYFMPLFVVLRPGKSFDHSVKEKIRSTLRKECSPRHVPDEIYLAPGIPYTISGKKTETPVKKILMGKDPATVVNAGALRNPEAMQYFVEFYKTHLAKPS